MVVDSTGLKIYGEGEWKVRIHGKSKRRSWRKLHLAVDPRPPLIKGIGQMGTVYADAAYIFQECFDAIDEKGGMAVIDLRGGTSLARDPTPGLKQRNRIVQELWDSSKKTWKQRPEYHRRSLVETQMMRWQNLGNLVIE